MKNHQSKRLEIVTNAEKLFVDKGYDNTNVEDILKAVNLSKGGFYHYFKTKEEVLLESMNQFSNQMLLEINVIVENTELDALEKLNLFLEKKKDLLKSKKDVLRYMTMLVKSELMFTRFCMISSNKYIEPLTKIIDQGVTEHIFKVEYPRETADILLRAITTLPLSRFYKDYSSNKDQSINHKRAMASIVSRTLGIDTEQLNMV